MPTVGTPAAVALVDLDGDGTSDLLVADSAQHAVQVSKGLGNGGFQALGSHAVGYVPVAIAAADLDGDGNLDVVTANIGSHDVSVLRGMGQADFMAAQHFSAGTNPNAVAVGLMDADAHPDVVTANEDGAIHVLQGLGYATFAVPTPYLASDSCTSVALVDVNQDGLLDLATVDFSRNALLVLLGSLDGSLSAAQALTAGKAPAHVLAADLDGDAFRDVVVSSTEEGMIRVRHGGESGLQPDVGFAVGSAPTQSVAADLDGDGVMDLLVVDAASSVRVVQGLGMGAFGWVGSIPLESQPIHGAVADLNGDGRPDLAVATYGDPDVLVFINQAQSHSSGSSSSESSQSGFSSTSSGAGGTSAPGSGSSGSSSELGSSSSACQPLTACPPGYECDRIPDECGGWVVCGECQAPRVCAGAGTPFTCQDPLPSTLFAPSVSYAVGSAPQAMASADLDGDARPDLAVAAFSSATVSVLATQADGTLVRLPDLPTAGSPVDVIAADLDANGHMDLVVAEVFNDGISVMLGQANGQFTDARLYATGTNSNAVQAADMDGNGALDLVVAHGDGTLAWLRGDGQGGFAAPTVLNVGVSLVDLWIADLLGDATLDILAADDAHQEFILLEGQGDGSWIVRGRQGLAAAPTAVTGLDVDGDGTQDVVACLADTAEVALVRVSGGMMQPAQLITVGTGPSALTSSDFNGDGHADLAVALAEGVVDVLLGSGDGQLEPLGVNTRVGTQPAGMVAVDLDGDHKPDLAVCNTNSNNVSVLINRFP